jgi:hypothetical protein
VVLPLTEEYLLIQLPIQVRLRITAQVVILLHLQQNLQQVYQRDLQKIIPPYLQALVLLAQQLYPLILVVLALSHCQKVPAPPAL